MSAAPASGLRGLLAAVALVATGCNLVFPLAAGGPTDATEASDGNPACWDLSQHGNEDGDAYADGCDPCPADPDTDPPIDFDNDRVGDACDTEPMLAGEQIVMFDGFATDTGWTQTMPGTVKFTPGELELTASGGEFIELVHEIPPAHRPGVQVYLDVDQAFAQGSADVRAFVEVGAAPTAKQVTCTFSAFQSATQLLIRIDGTDGPGRQLIGTGRLQLSLHQDAGGVFHCRGRRGAGAVVEVRSAMISDQSASRVGVFAGNFEPGGSSITTTFHAITAFSTP